MKTRSRFDQARGLVEEHYAPLAVGVAPWDGGAGSTTPYGVFRAQLENAGYEVGR